MLRLTGFELYSRWVPLKTVNYAKCGIFKQVFLKAVKNLR